MNPDMLLRHFDEISEAPDAISRLRPFILDLAVRGKLVPQDPNDEPASELLKRIQTEKDRITPRCQDTKKEKLLPPVGSDEFPFELPRSWAWCCIGDVAQYGIPDRVGSNKDISEDTWVLDLEDVEKDTSRLIDRVPSSARPFQSTKTIFKRGDVLFGKLRPYLNKVLVADRDGVCTTEIVPIRGYCGISPEYTKLVLKSPLTMERVDRLMYGMKMPRLGTNDAIVLNFPLPPLAEQHRIVAKVDELMALCDELERAQNRREKRRDRVVAATLHGLNNGTNGEDFHDTAHFYFNHLPRLTTRPEHVQQFRQTILSLAVRGKLVPQDPTDEHVSELLKRIDQERALIAKKDRRAEARLQDLLADELCWKVPPTWNWRGVADLALFIDYRGKTPAKVESGVRLITAKNVRPGFINLEPEEFVTETTYNEWMTRGLPREGDVLFTTEAPMGNAAVVRIYERFGLAQRVINLRPYGGLGSDFLVLQFLAQSFQVILDKTATGLTAKGIKAAKLKRLPLTVPPLAEQHRIVAKVNELMVICDELETRLTTTSTTRRQLLKSAIN